ncbi:MAG TPA: O-antigen ligase family protein [Pirellulales bacterium]|nr:O-antigen ligase family protein [Pirellulales bacterium]
MNVFKKIGLWYVLATPILAGFSTFEFKADEGFTVTGLIWVLQFATGVLLLPFVWSSDDHRGDLRAWWPWLGWAAILFMSIAWCGNLGRRNIQEAMQLCMPVVVGMVAASVIRSRNDLRWFLGTFNVAMVFLALFTLLFISGRFDEEWISTRVRPAALTMTLIGCVYLSYYPRYKILPVLGWGTCILLTLLTQSRMATMTLLVAPIVFPVYHRRWINLAAVVALGFVGVGLFYTPIIQKKFFESGSGGITEAFSGDFAGAGRFEAWPEIWKEAWTHPLLGAGVGSAYDFVPQVWEDIFHVHNDYLRVFFELGIVGEVIFVFAMLWQLVFLYRHTQIARGLTRSTFVAAFMGWCALMISSGSDNTIIYNIYFTNLLFALIGAANGVFQASTADAHLPQPATSADLTNMHYRPI